MNGQLYQLRDASAPLLGLAIICSITVKASRVWILCQSNQHLIMNEMIIQVMILLKDSLNTVGESAMKSIAEEQI